MKFGDTAPAGMSALSLAPLKEGISGGADGAGWMLEIPAASIGQLVQSYKPHYPLLWLIYRGVIKQ